VADGWAHGVCLDTAGLADPKGGALGPPWTEPKPGHEHTKNLKAGVSRRHKKGF